MKPNKIEIKLHPGQLRHTIPFSLLKETHYYQRFLIVFHLLNLVVNRFLHTNTGIMATSRINRYTWWCKKNPQTH